MLSQGQEIQESDLKFSQNSNGKDSFFGTDLTLDDYNRKIIRHYLGLHENNVTSVAKILDIGKTTIYRMMKDEKGI